MIVALDIGYSNAKAALYNGGFEKVVVFPARAARARVGLKEGRLEVRPRGGSGSAYFVGKDAETVSEGSLDVVRDHQYFLTNEWAAILARAVYSLGVKRGEVTLALGLPYDQAVSQDSGIRRSVASMARAVLASAIVGDTKLSVVVPSGKLLVTSQGHGALTWALNSEIGPEIEDDVANGQVMVVDVGGNTVNVITYVREHDDSEASGALMMGVREAIEKLGGVLRQNSIIADPRTVWETGRYVSRGRVYDASAYIEAAEKEYVAGVIRALRANFGAQIETSSAIILVGGGADILAKPLGELHHRVIVPPHPIEANVRGYAIIAASRGG